MTKTSLYRAPLWLLTAALSGCIVTAPPPPPPAAPPPPPVYQQGDEQASEPPPPLPEYEQPPCPEPGYIWTPGVWQWGPEGYYWVPGTWVGPPQPGLLWTPGYWILAGGAVYVFHRGYWAPHVGYYGGLNYGGGYVGTGYAGGRWAGNTFQYNTAVSNVNVTNIHNTYNETVINNVTVNNVTNITRVSYAGAPGTRTQPTAAEAAVMHETHVPPTAVQTQHVATARSNPQLNATRNEGHPPIAATPRPNAYTEHGVTQAKPGGPAYHPQRPPQKQAARPEERRDERPPP